VGALYDTSALQRSCPTTNGRLVSSDWNWRYSSRVCGKTLSFLSMYKFDSGWRLVEGCCEHCNERSGSIKFLE
jgi:hypothetical protein